MRTATYFVRSLTTDDSFRFTTDSDSSTEYKEWINKRANGKKITVTPTHLVVVPPVVIISFDDVASFYMMEML